MLKSFALPLFYFGKVIKNIVFKKLQFVREFEFREAHNIIKEGGNLYEY